MSRPTAPTVTFTSQMHIRDSLNAYDRLEHRHGVGKDSDPVPRTLLFEFSESLPERCGEDTTPIVPRPV